ncbi:MAG: hypothetical protein ACYDAY_02375 [Candidatus Dormibacteria bacterium]
MVVTVPAAATMDEGRPPLAELKVSGAGALAGFALQSADAALMGFTLGDCWTLHCLGSGYQPSVNDSLVQDLGFPYLHDQTMLISPGTYRLSLITDGSPGTVTFSLAGLSGSANLSPDQPSSGVLLSYGGGPVSVPLFRGGSGGTVGANGGWYFSNFTVTGRSPGFLEAAYCQYATASPDPATANLPGCPGGSGLSDTTPLTDCCWDLPGYEGRLGAWWLTGPIGRHAQTYLGVFSNSGPFVESEGFVNVFLSN